MEPLHKATRPYRDGQSATLHSVTFVPYEWLKAVQTLQDVHMRTYPHKGSATLIPVEEIRFSVPCATEARLERVCVFGGRNRTDALINVWRSLGAGG